MDREGSVSVQQCAEASRRSAVRRLSAASVLVVCALTLPPHTRGETGPLGSITGHVTLTSRMRGTPIGTATYAPRGVTHQAMPTAPEMRNVVVYLKGVTYTEPLQPMHAQIRQENESFSPHVLAVTRGSTVEFPNADPYFHNVFSLSGAASFDLGRYPSGQSRSRQLTRAGVVKVYCHIHSQMSATVLVLDHPYFVTPEADGQFTLPNVPSGNYTLVGWHERVGEQEHPISVRPGEATTANLSLPVGDPQ
jgi:plastocyanin